jgi:hypothetical protein
VKPSGGVAEMQPLHEGPGEVFLAVEVTLYDEQCSSAMLIPRACRWHLLGWLSVPSCGLLRLHDVPAGGQTVIGCLKQQQCGW